MITIIKLVKRRSLMEISPEIIHEEHLRKEQRNRRTRCDRVNRWINTRLLCVLLSPGEVAHDGATFQNPEALRRHPGRLRSGSAQKIPSERDSQVFFWAATKPVSCVFLTLSNIILTFLFPGFNSSFFKKKEKKRKVFILLSKHVSVGLQGQLCGIMKRA